MRLTERRAPVNVAVLDHREHHVLGCNAAAFGKTASHGLVERMLHFLRARARRHVDQEALIGAFEPVSAQFMKLTVSDASLKVSGVAILRHQRS
jgi:hypothetical protein